MPFSKTITIIGGGLAGLTLGIGLRRVGVPVTLWEAGRYPRHRVCGEFICGRGQAVLDRLGLLERCLQAGAVQARTARFICGGSKSPVRPLDSPALCLSRYKLDALLAGTFQKAGGELRVNERWTGSECEGLVRATGRRSQTMAKLPRWFGIKAHVPGQCAVALEADLEMHITPDGYIGLNRIGDGEVNVCGLFRLRAEKERPESKEDWLRGEANSALRQRLGAAEFDPDSICSVAGLELRPQLGLAGAECRIGDTLTMTPPVTGNGMSMALESAELAMEPLAEYSKGRLDWPEARRQIAQRCEAAFARRLAWARLLQWMVISPALQGSLCAVLLRSDWLWRLIFARTR